MKCDTASLKLAEIRRGLLYIKTVESDVNVL